MSKLCLISKVCICLSMGVLAGCNLNSITDSANNIDGELINPDVVESKDGARWIYLGAVAKFNDFFGYNAAIISRFTDEFALLPPAFQTRVDTRLNNINDGSNYPYFDEGNSMQKGQATKVQLQQAIQLIDEYYQSSGNAMKVHSAGLLGLVYIMFADNFCSGIAMSESNYGGEFVPGRSLSRDSLYLRAIESANNGLSLGVDSLPLNYFLKGVKGRALNSLGRYEEAAEIVSEIPDAFSIGETFSFVRLEDIPYQTLIPVRVNEYHILNKKGTNGMNWVADNSREQDMRVPIRTNVNGSYIIPVQPEFFSVKRSIPFFSGAEARLIEAEFHLNNSNITQFIEKINSVRRMYRKRSGMVLNDTTDPGTYNGRVNLLFKERAYTFYVTGRRMVDLRRLTSHYNRPPETVWPIGKSEATHLFIEYGNNYFFVPEEPGIGTESLYNPNYTGCDNYEI